MKNKKNQKIVKKSKKEDTSFYIDTSNILQSFQSNKKNLIPILQEIQKKFGYLPETAMELTAEFLNISESTIYGVATFYPYFKLVPTGKNIIKVCRGTACHVRGGAQVLKETEKQLGIKPGESTDDLEYFLDTVACIGACAISPTITINEKTYGYMTPKKIIETFENRKNKDK